MVGMIPVADFEHEDTAPRFSRRLSFSSGLLTAEMFLAIAKIDGEDQRHQNGAIAPSESMHETAPQMSA